MPIKFHKTTKIFHLYNQEISYIFKILKNNQLGHFIMVKQSKIVKILIIYLKLCSDQWHHVLLKAI